MTIHRSHPFAPPPESRAPARRLRGLLPSPVSIWASESGGEREGWTISSMLIADGDPAQFIALVHEDAEWWDLFRETGLAVVSILGQGQGWVSEVFARAAPSPGGVFRTGQWASSGHGPRLEGAAAWAGVRLLDAEPEHAGWGLLVRAEVEWIEIADGVAALEHRGGRYT